jgi:hypothetical protein
MASRFWVGGSGTWNGSNTTNWAATSGGGGGQTVPTSSDTVTFDTNSGASATVTIATVPASCSALTINKADLTLTQSDVLVVSGTFTLTTGSYNSNGQAVTCGSINWQNTNTRAVTLGSSTITTTGQGGLTMGGPGLTASTSSASLVYNGENPAASHIGTYAAVTIIDTSGNPNSSFITLNGGATVGTMVITTPGVNSDLYTINVAANFTITGTMTLTGFSSTDRLRLASSSAGVARTVTGTGATFNFTNLDVKDITIAGSPTAGTKVSVASISGNTGLAPWLATAGSAGDSAGRSLNRLAATTGLDAQGAANVWAGTVGLDLVGALNVKAGTVGLEYNGVCRRLAANLSGNSELDAQGALASIP